MSLRIPSNQIINKYAVEGKYMFKQSSIVADRVDVIEGLLRPAPFVDGIAVEEVTGDGRDIGSGEGVEVDIKSKVTNSRALGLDIKHIIVSNDWRNIAGPDEGLRIGDNRRRG